MSEDVERLEDIFTVQDEIAEAIVIAFGGEYLRAEWRRARRRPTDNLDAWGLVQKSRSQNLPVNRTATEEALGWARQAVALDPGAWLGRRRVAETPHNSMDLNSGLVSGALRAASDSGLRSSSSITF